MTVSEQYPVATDTAERILQREAENEDFGASAIVALRPSTGDVLVAANGPGSNGVNIATEGQYAPGSTFKVVTALALLRSGIEPEDIVPCPRTITVDGRKFKNYDMYPDTALGDITFAKGFAESCNTNLISQRDKLSDDALVEAGQALGMATEYELGYPAYMGQIPAPETQTEEAAALIGQGRILASPLAMATVAASVQAGEAVVPTLIRDESQSAHPRKPLSPGEAAAVEGLMRGVVTDGIAPFLADVPGGEVRAKTGTAEHGDTADEPPSPHAWMIATQDDLAVAVFVENGVGGAETAGPLVKEFLEVTNELADG